MTNQPIIASGAQWNLDTRNKIRSFILTASKPVTNKDICEYLGLTYNRSRDRIVRKQIEILVMLEDQAIVSGDEGYHYAKSYEDALRERDRFVVPARAMYKRGWKALDNYLKDHPEDAPKDLQLSLEDNLFAPDTMSGSVGENSLEK